MNGVYLTFPLQIEGFYSSNGAQKAKGFSPVVGF